MLTSLFIAVAIVGTAETSVVAIPLFPRQAEVLLEFFDPSKNYTELALKWGKGSGKDYVAGCGIAYMVYLTLKLSDPQAHYGLAKIRILAVAIRWILI